MFQINLSGTVMSPTEIYDTAEDRQMQRFDALVGSDLVPHGALVQQAVAVRVVLKERA